ncbi:TonB-dependent receptor [Kordiimonas pumila]|uniref:TonB-dependent receptor n=1 Tax=Kordiimonas pumila TaxID=2161677 RepID=A0ABV7D4T4_9PROT|nr:TonB-dependent receptor [Kordiimonas pumila]
MVLSNKRKWLTTCGLVALCPAVAFSAHAQENETKQRGNLFEEIVVTAQKREQSQQDVGIAITALSGEQMKRLGYTNAQEVTALAPGVSTIQPNGEANYAIGIRGVSNSDFTTNVESPIAIYVDEVYISQMSGAGFMLFDMARVEVLRGPQGTLFGRNATGGLVHYISEKPKDEFEGYGSITYGSFDRVKAEGAVNIPLSDTLAMRVSLATHQGGGYIENRVNPNADLNNANEFAGRVQLLYTPNEDFDLLLNARYGSQDIRTGFFEYVSAINPDATPTPTEPNSNLGGYNDTDGDVYAGDYDFAGRNDLSTKGLSATINWQIGDIKLTSITDYQQVKRDYIEDSDASPVNYFNFFLTTDVEQFSQELRLSGGTDNFNWVTGFYYLDLNISDSNGTYSPGWFDDFLPVAFGVTPADLGGTNGLLNPYTTKTKSWSLFGQATYAFNEEFALTAGIRWIDENKTHDYRDILVAFPDTLVSGSDPATVEIGDAVLPYSGERNDGNWSARVQLDFTPNDDMLLYASWNRGVKSGGFNAPLLPTDVLVTDQFMNYGPEKLDAFEVGMKWSINRTSRLNVASYYYDYNHCQAFSIVGLDTFTLNADCKSKGFEVEYQTSPAQGLDMLFGVGFIDAEVNNIPGVTFDVDTPLGVVAAAAPGQTLTPVQTPKWNLNGLVRYEVPVGSGYLAFQADAQYRSEHFFALIESPASTEKGYTIANASITWIPEEDNWSLRFFVNNITDAEYTVQTFDLSGNIDNGGVFFGMIEQYYGRPRTWGVNLSYSF